MHDDQHGTAIVVLAALLGAVKVLDREHRRPGRSWSSGAGAAGVACTNILLNSGHRATSSVLDSKGIVDERSRRPELLQGRAGPAHQSARPAPAGSPRRSTVPTSSSGVLGRSGSRGADRDDGAQAASCSRCRTPIRRSIPTRHASTRPVVATGAQRLPEPDQQRAGLPRGLPGRAGRRCAAHHRGDESRCRTMRSSRSSGTTWRSTTSCPARWIRGSARPWPQAVAEASRVLRSRRRCAGWRWSRSSRC